MLLSEGRRGRLVSSKKPAAGSLPVGCSGGLERATCGSPGFADDCFLSRATEASPALARARSRYGPMDKARRICKNANVQDYGSRDSVYAYITREDLVRIPVAIFFFFFCPLDHLRRGKPNSGVWRRMSTLVPYERRARPAKYHDVGARSPRRHEVHAARAVEPWGARRRRDAGWLAATRRSSPP